MESVLSWAFQKLRQQNGSCSNVRYYDRMYYHLPGSEMYFRAAWFRVFTDDCIYFDHCSISTVCRDGTQKFMPALYEALGVYLPLITTNCAVLGVAIKNISNGYGFIESVVCGFCTAFGFLISIVIMAGIRERIEHNDVPNAFKGNTDRVSNSKFDGNCILRLRRTGVERGTNI